MKYLLTSTLLLIALFSQAQLKFGARAGLNIVKLSFTSEDFETGFRPDFHIGAMAGYQIQEQLSIKAELLYSREGTTEKRLDPGVKGKIWMSQLQLPVLALYRFNENLYAEAGPQFGLLLSATERYGGSGEKRNIRPYYKALDIRVPLGIGYEFTREPVSGLSVALRYSFGLMPLNKVEVGGGNLRSQVISLALGYWF